MRHWIIVAGVGLAAACGDDSGDGPAQDAAISPMSNGDSGSTGNPDDRPHSDAGIDSGKPDSGSSPSLDGTIADSPDGALADAAVVTRNDAGDAGSTTPDGGSDAGPTSDSGAVESFAAIYADILEPICAGCHTGAAHTSQLDMSTEELAHTNLVGAYSLGSQCASSTVERIRVVRGNSAASLLIDKIEPDPSCGSRMPLSSNGPFLSGANINRIRRWIDQGAPRN